MNNNSKNKDSKLVKKIKQKIYAWHRIIGLITLIPVLFWTLSGLMHPFMAHFFKPTIANESIENINIDKSHLKLSIKEVLQKNNISQFKNFRIVTFKNSTFYQVKTIKNKFEYFNTLNSTKLTNGDQQYAHWLSRYFLDDFKSTIKKTEILTKFNTQYKYVNRYLPVYKITYNRPDAMEIYVETASSKLSTFNPKSRQRFIWFFDTFHNWAFIDWISNNSIRIVVMCLCLSIIFFSALSGILIYSLFWKKFKKANQINPKKGFRKYHRQIGIWISIFTLTFAFSGAFHVTKKWTPYTLDKMIYEPIFETKALHLSNTCLPLDWSRFKNTSIISFNDSIYYRNELVREKNIKNYSLITDSQSKGSKKDKPKQETIYVNAFTNKIAPELDKKYAQFLAYYFSEEAPKAACCEIDDTHTYKHKLEDTTLLETKILSDFESKEYGFVNKRLPVVKLAFDTEDKTTYFIETSTSRLAAKIDNSDRIEGYSFAIFHKFIFMDWAGKSIRDLTIVLSALTILIVSILGLFLFFKK